MPQQTPREQLDGPIGSIISNFIGDKTLQDIFEANGDAEALEANKNGKPSAFIAMDLGIIDKDTKTALLMAQAGERIVRRAEAIQDLASGRTTGIDSALSAADNDEVFKFVGSDRDPKQMQEAQAGWQISQVMLNQAMNATARNDNKALHELTRATAGFQTLAASYVETAAEKLAEAGFEAGAEKMRGVAKELAAVPLGQGNNTPHAAIETLKAQEASKAGQDSDRFKLCEKLSGLTAAQAAPAAPELAGTTHTAKPALKM